MKKLLSIIFMSLALSVFGQDKYEITENDYENENVEMADTMRSEGKIYVVVGIVTLILLALLGYVVKTESKIKKLENQLDKTDKNHSGGK